MFVASSDRRARSSRVLTLSAALLPGEMDAGRSLGHTLLRVHRSLLVNTEHVKGARRLSETELLVGAPTAEQEGIRHSQGVDSHTSLRKPCGPSRPSCPPKRITCPR